MKMKLTSLALLAGVMASCGSPEKSVMDNIMTRTSVRAYTSEKISEEKIELLLRAGMAAPSAKNRQLWEFVVVDDRALLDSLASGLRYAKMLTQAPLAIVVCVRDHFVNEQGILCPHDCWQCDGAVAAQNILLAAHAYGLGAVYTAANDEQRASHVRSVLGIPAEVHPVCVIPIGYPAEKPEPKDKWKTEKIHRNIY